MSSGDIPADVIPHDGGQIGQGKRDVTREKTERKDDRLGQMCPFQLSGAEILVLDLTGCLTPPPSLCTVIILNSLKHAAAF